MKSDCPKNKPWKKSLATKFIIGGFFVSTLSLGMMLPNEADARFITRRACKSYQGGARMGKMMGKRNASRLVNAIWNRLGRSCSQVDQLAQIIADTPFAKPFGGGLMAACFYMGYTDELWDSIADIYDRCGQKCFNAGSDVGNISAQGYCMASMVLGGLDDPGFISQPPLPFCGHNLVLGCKSEYISVAKWKVPGCHKYTTGLFSETFENSVRQDCYVPEDVPILDVNYGQMGLSTYLN